MVYDFGISMMLYILLSTFVISLISLIGIITLGLKKYIFHKMIFALVAFSAGTLLSGAFLHLISESLEHIAPSVLSLYVLLGFVMFFLIEKLLHWRHCHKETCKIHPVSYLILLGDAVHNFIDGLVIAASFSISMHFGIITTILIIAHEIPQELGDFAVLVYSGMKKHKALLFNFISQLTCILGGIAGYFMSSVNMFIVLLPISAGGFIYISASDLIPELHKEKRLKKSIISFVYFLIGIGFVICLKVIEI